MDKYHYFSILINENRDYLFKSLVKQYTRIIKMIQRVLNIEPIIWGNFNCEFKLIKTRLTIKA